MATYDTYAVWTWSFSGAQQTGSWLPGPVKLGFDPKVLTGMGYLERNELVAKAFTGRESMCALLPPTGATDLLFDRSSGFVATYDVTPAASYRVDPRERDLESIDREVGPGLRYRDAGGFDELELQGGATYRVSWSDPGIRRIAILAQMPVGEPESMTVDTGKDIAAFAADSQLPTRYVIDTPAGVDSVVITATRNVRLFRVSGFTEVPGFAGSDGPFLTDMASFCR